MAIEEQSRTSSEDTQAVLTRNQLIKKLLNDGLHPLLPFEESVLGGRLEEHTQSQRELSELFSQSMQQSSETWHDNAPADVIKNDARVLSERAGFITNALHYGRALPYPEDAEDHVTLGSLIGVRYGKATVIDYMFLAGRCREVPEEVASVFPSDTVVTTLTTPIGAALFDATVGEDVSFVANGRTIHVSIAELLQFNPEA